MPFISQGTTKMKRLLDQLKQNLLSLKTDPPLALVRTGLGKAQHALRLTLQMTRCRLSAQATAVFSSFTPCRMPLPTLNILMGGTLNMMRMMTYGSQKHQHGTATSPYQMGLHLLCTQARTKTILITTTLRWKWALCPQMLFL